MNPTLTKTYTAGAALSGKRIVKFSADGEVSQAAAATDLLAGVADGFGAEGTDTSYSTGDRVDVHRAGLVEVRYGGTIARGKPVTSDANGKAVEATVAGSKAIGIAEVSGVAGDIGTILIAPHQI